MNSDKLETAKQKGLLQLCEALREAKLSYAHSLQVVIQFAKDNGGSVREQGCPKEGDFVTVVELNDDEFHCFQLFADIDLFYWEN